MHYNFLCCLNAKPAWDFMGVASGNPTRYSLKTNSLIFCLLKSVWFFLLQWSLSLSFTVNACWDWATQLSSLLSCDFSVKFPFVALTKSQQHHHLDMTRHVDRGKPRKPCPYTKYYRHLKDAGSRGKSLPRKRELKLVIQHQMINPQNIHLTQQPGQPIGALLSFHQRSIFLQQDGNSQVLCREWETLEHSALNGLYPSSPSPQDSRKPAEEGQERVSNPEVNRGHQGNNAF